MQYFGFDRPSFAFKTYGFGANFDPLDLFAGGKQGVWYDPSDKSTLFQDAAGTIPVTAHGDPIGLMKDKSGNGNHAKQTVSASRPTYYDSGTVKGLSTDGTDDYFVFTKPININSGSLSICAKEIPKVSASAAVLSGGVGGYILMAAATHTYNDWSITTDTFGVNRTIVKTLSPKSFSINMLSGVMTIIDSNGVYDTVSGGSGLGAAKYLFSYDGGAGFKAKGIWCGVIMTDFNLSSDSRGDVLQYLDDKVGL